MIRTTIERIRKAIESKLTKMFGTGMTRYPSGPYDWGWHYPVRSGPYTHPWRYPVSLESEVRNPLDQVSTVPELARRWGKGERTVRRMIYAGELPARKSGGVWLIRVEKEKELVL